MQIETIKQLADAQFEHSVYKKNLKEKLELNLLVPNSGGLFRSSPELIVFAKTWDIAHDLYLEDLYGNPIRIIDREKFVNELCNAYQFAMNQWFVEFEKSKKIRKLSDV